MTAYKLTVLRLEEIKDCAVVCGCGAKVTVPLDRLESLNGSKKCPSCSKDYDQSVIEVLKDLKLAHTHAKTAAFKVEFHITQEQ